MSRPQPSSMPCVLTKKRAPEFFASCSRRALAKRAPTTPSRFTPWSAFSISRLVSSLPAPSTHEAGMPEASAPVKGTRPEGAVTEADASQKVREMFTAIAPRYDLLNHLLSLQLDRLWRARAAKRLGSILNRPDALVLDLCCGTGILPSHLRTTEKRASSAQTSPIPCSFARARKAPRCGHRRIKALLYRCHSSKPTRSGSRSQVLRLIWSLLLSDFVIWPITKPACAKFSASSSPAAPSLFWNLPNRPKECWAIFIAGIFVKCCRRLAASSPAIKPLTNISQNPSPVSSAPPN